MNSRKAIWTLVAVLVTGVAAWFAMLAYDAHRNLVTLDVRDMNVRDVVNKMEHQTWEVIYVDKAVEGKVTMKVHKMPLEEALRIVASQVFARAATLYPLYSTSQSYTALKQSLRGEVDPATHGWTNLQSRPFAFGFGGGGFGGGRGGMPGFGGPPGGGGAQNQLVSLNIAGKDVNFATLALNRFASVRVVPEDGVTTTVNLVLKQATVPEAVAQLAKAADRKWTTIYALQGGFGGGMAGGGPGGPGGFGRPPMGDRDTNGPGPRGFNPFGGGPDLTDEQREAARKQRETQEQELLATLPAAERQKIEQAQQEREQLMKEMANMTDEQRREKMTQLMGGSGQMDKMIRGLIMNSTPEQRARMGGPGGRGPGGGGGGPGGGRGGPGR